MLTICFALLTSKEIKRNSIKFNPKILALERQIGRMLLMQVRNFIKKNLFKHFNHFLIKILIFFLKLTNNNQKNLI